MKKPLSVIFVASLLAFGTISHAADTYHLLKKIPIPGEWTWDYIGIDSANRHVFVSHGPQLEILNADTYKLDGKIITPGADFSKPETLKGQGVRGGAAAPDLGRGFMPNARDGSVSV